LLTVKDNAEETVADEQRFGETPAKAAKYLAFRCLNNNEITCFA